MKLALSEPEAGRAKIIAIYLFMGGLWILFSDRLIEKLVKEPGMMTRLQTCKGWLFVVFTAWILSLLIDRYSRDTQSYIANLGKTESALHETREHLNLALKSSAAGTWDWNIAEDSLVWDEYMHSLFGLPPDTFPGKVEDFFNLIHPEDRKSVRAAVADALEGKAEYDTHYRVIRPGGSIHHIAARGKVYRDDEGRAVRMIGICWDVTGRKLAEDASREKEESYRLLFENMLDGYAHCKMIFKDNLPQDFVYLDVNRAFEELTGLSDVVGKKVTDIIPGIKESHSELFELYARVSLTGHPERFEIYLEQLAAWLFVSVYGTKKGQFVAVFDNITKRKEAEDALQESEKRFRDILETIDLVSVVLDMEGNVTFCNDFLLDLTGYDRREVLGANWFDLFIPDESKKTIKARYVSGIKEADLPLHYENEILTRWKDRRLIVWNNTILHDPGGKIHGMAALGRDVTEQRNLEAQLRQAQKMEALGTLAGGIAHDFNNILGAILGYTELALIDSSELATRRTHLREVLKATDRARDLVKQILAFSRRSEQEKIPTQIGPIIKEALMLLRASLPATIEIEQDVATKGTMLGDPTQIHQILMNLCTNSSHSMRKKGGILRVGLCDVDLDFSETGSSNPDMKPGPYVRLTVSDTGCGIDPAIMPRIFDPFFTTKGPREGTGMGLSVVHGIVKSHGGFINVESKPGEGTSFQVFFPRLEAAVAPEAGSAPVFTGGSERILFVDDEPMIAALGKEMLERLGYRVVCTTSSIDALEIFRNQSLDAPFDLVITDLTMPDMTGVELAGEILRLQPEIPVVLCSGFGEAVTQEQAQRMGIRAYIMKPLAWEQLAELVRKVLDER